ncbi:MAG TPA: hypothetical protein VF854_00580 [Azonexus sp.]|jgi:hypothetical protein
MLTPDLLFKAHEFRSLEILAVSIEAIGQTLATLQSTNFSGMNGRIVEAGPAATSGREGEVANGRIGAFQFAESGFV